MPRDFTLDDYKAALKGPGNKRAKAGWKYLVAHGVAESEIFDALRGAVFPDPKVEKDRKEWQRIQVKAAQVRALGKQLRKHSQLLRKVLNQYPELVPARAENLLRQHPKLVTEMGIKNFELIKRIRLETRDIPVVLEAVATQLSECRAKKSQLGNATLRRMRLGQGPDIYARILLHLFWDAGARFCDPGSAPFEWAAELFNLACRLAGYRETFSADGLLKMEKEKSLKNYLEKAKRKKDPTREARIQHEAIADAYGPEERCLGWYNYLARNIHFPFQAKCIAAETVSPLRESETVEVGRMAPEDECWSDMLVLITWHGRNVAVPLSQLTPVDADESTAQGIADWHYWVARGYCF